MDKAQDRAIDELLVIRCQAGEQASFDLLVRRWQRRLWQYALRLTGDPDAAWDVTQETWMAVLRQLRKLTDPAWFAAWIYRIVRNKSADYCRTARRLRNLAVGVAEQQRSKPESQRDDCRDAAEALAQLPPESQELLTLRYSGNLTILELAVVLGIPAGTVKSRLHYARERLRQILKGEKP